MRRLIANFIHFWPPVCAAIAAIGALALLWYVRDTPLEFGANMRVDALTAFFGLVVLSGLTLTLARAWQPRLARRQVLAAVALLLVFATTLTPAIVGGYLVFALAVQLARRPLTPGRARFSRAALLGLLRRAVDLAPWPLAAVSLLLGYGAFALRGALRYTDIGAGAALDSFVFWFVLVAAALPLVPLRSLETGPESQPALALAWLYPLVRLYSLGPWNTGWSLATVLVGAGLAGWCSLAALVERERRLRVERLLAVSFALALAAIGLATSAGIAAACFGMLAALVLSAGLNGATAQAPRNRAGDSHEPLTTASAERSTSNSLIGWLLAGIFPFTAPFVATWMLLGAGVAAGVPLLAGVAWLVALLNGLTIALWEFGGLSSDRKAASIAATSVALGVGAPLIVRGLIQPVVAQLQGGLTSYGDVAIWPWVGLAANDAANVQVTTLPSIAIGALMLVLAALVYVVIRLRETYTPVQPEPLPDGEAPAAYSTRLRDELLRNIRDDVPWLGVLLGPRRQAEDAPRDPE